MLALTSRACDTRIYLEELGARGAQPVLRGCIARRRLPGSRLSGRLRWIPHSYSLSPRDLMTSSFLCHIVNTTE